MFAWESADTGDEVTPRWALLTILTLKTCGLVPIAKYISADIAYAVRTTGWLL